MGKTIDRAALHVLAALALYLFFVSAFGDIWLAAGCALCALLLLRKLLLPLAGRLPKREAVSYTHLTATGKAMAAVNAA